MKPFSALLALTLLLATPLRADENVTHFADTEARAQVRATLSDRPLPPGW